MNLNIKVKLEIVKIKEITFLFLNYWTYVGTYVVRLKVGIQLGWNFKIPFKYW